MLDEMFLMMLCILRYGLIDNELMKSEGATIFKLLSSWRLGIHEIITG